jgi:hypothetical protein
MQRGNLLPVTDDPTAADLSELDERINASTSTVPESAMRFACYCFASNVPALTATGLAVG